MNNENTTSATYIFPAERLEETKTKLKKFQKKAKKLSLPIPSLEVVEYFTNSEYKYPRDAFGFKVLIPMVRVKLTRPEILKIGEYTLVATIDHDETANVVRMNPNIEMKLSESWWSAKSLCSHCNVNRRRNVTHLVTKDGENLRQIGSTCVRDFLGLDPTKAIASMYLCFDIMSALDEEFIGSGGYAPLNPSTEEFLARISSVVRADNDMYITRKRAEQDGCMSTVDIANDPNLGRERSALPTWGGMQKSDFDNAREAIEWATDLDGESEFERNLKAIALRGFVEFKQEGIAGYIFEGHRRHIRKLAEDKIEKANAKNYRHIGTVGKREEFAVVIKRKNVTFNNWGACHIYTFAMNGCGSELTWFGSNELTGYEIGDVLTIRATVKKHDEYKGKPQTVVTRVSAQ